ncbi:nuclease-related domain-containing DEAD/DEAH box helicase [Pseudomonas sp. EA_65y_Pfl2_P74]|uniref:nuclease-related domain-containing DEAD/DEAH box helicase n=1 Tax=Pseudomonas sp. EA_65y_Pfl2_P74 TaxID=3088694 RepID=UPI0030DB6686
MIPEHGPHHTESYGERQLYSVLKSNLPDEYTVIHSLPWLCSAVNKLDRSAKPTGEIDFLVIHPENGVLALEVKSGVYRVENSVFIHVREGFKINPVSQTRKNVHGFSEWLGAKPTLRLNIGYGFIFPNTDFGEGPCSPGMYDTSANPPQPLYIDFQRYPDVAEKIIELMKYWKQALSNSDLGLSKTQELIDYLSPTIDGHPRWASRIRYDNKVWLQLTREQSAVVRSVLNSKHSLISGWPGTGKTLVAIEVARKFAAEGKNVLVLSFNSRLTDYIRDQLDDYKSCTVMTWHGLCRQSADIAKRGVVGEDWYKVDCVEDLKAAIQHELMTEYDALVVDESQALAHSWCETLVSWFDEKPKAFFCDETQVFKFERNVVSLEGLKEILDVEAFPLTIILRMPKAVTEILAEVVPPKLQHSSPRVVEPDTALEVITLSPCEELLRIKSMLVEEGVDNDDIVVLTGSIIDKVYVDFLRFQKIPTETIAKFRGLEAPVVIVVGAEALDTAELFSAYSRATTKFIALYNAHNRFWKGNRDFQSRLQKNPNSAEVLTQQQVPLRIRNLIAGSTTDKSLGLKSLDIRWAEEWRAWLVEIKSHETQILLWLEYLCIRVAHPVFIWYGDTLTRFYRIKPDLSGDNESSFRSLMIMEFCKVCDRLTPHTDTFKCECALCATAATRSAPIDEDVMEEIRLYDAAITSQLSKSYTLQMQAELPIEVAAVGAILRASKNKVRANVLLAPLPSGRLLYLVAFVFAQSRIATYPAKMTMSVNNLADEIYKRFKSLEKISLTEWRAIFANAFGTFKQKGFVARLEKGLYLPLEDKDAPIPQRTTYV